MLLELSAVLALAQQCAPQVSPHTMAAIARVESQFNPYAIGVNGSSRLRRQPTSREEAIRTATALLSQGKNIDLGLGQINSNNLEWLKLSVADAFDPCRNMAASAKVLTSNYQSVSASAPSPQHALRVALSMYNTGSQTRGFGNGYVRKVENAAVLLAGGIPGRLPLLAAAPALPPAAAGDPVEAAFERAEQIGAAPTPRSPPPAWDVFARAEAGGVHVFGGPSQ